MRVLSLLSPLLSGNKAFDTPSLASFHEHDEKKKQSEIEGDDRLWASNAAPVTRLFLNIVIFLLKIILISDKPLLRGQPPVSDSLRASSPRAPGCRVWP